MLAVVLAVAASQITVPASIHIVMDASHGRRLCGWLQAAFGRRSLGISGFFVYLALGLGLLGSSLALPFGLYVFICQRNPETTVQVWAWLWFAPHSWKLVSVAQLQIIVHPGKARGTSAMQMAVCQDVQLSRHSEQ